MKLDTFLYSYPIRGVIQEQNLQFVCTEVQGYLPTLVWEFYTNLRENQRVETLLETTVMGKQIKITPDLIAHSLQYMFTLPLRIDLTSLGPSLILTPICSLRPCVLILWTLVVLYARNMCQGSSSQNMH